jgi:hypothetical protein
MEFMLLKERWESGEAVRVSGEVVPVEEEGETERLDEKAVLRRRRETEVGLERRGVKDWKRFWRVGEDILGVVCGRKLLSRWMGGEDSRWYV